MENLLGKDRNKRTQASKPNRDGIEKCRPQQGCGCSLETDNRGGGAKRKRTRHQHFWRNTDKLDATERVYIPTASIKPALRRNEPVVRPPRETNLQRG